jgi:hypothetical protein
MRLTKRDVQIVLTVSTYRLISSAQIEALLFQSDKPRGRQSSCQRRLQLLYHHGYLDRLRMPVILGEGRFPHVYVLDHAGATLVAATLGVDRATIAWRPHHNLLESPFIFHSLAINDLRVVITLLAQGNHFELIEWIDEPSFRSAKDQVPFRMRGAAVVRNYPDGYLELTLPYQKQSAHFFIEVDQGTMSLARWKEKVQAYAEFRARGLSEHHYGTRNFRVLTVTTTSQRLANLKRASEQAGADHFFWFTTQAHVDIWNPRQLLQPIWSLATKKGNEVLLPQDETPTKPL